MAYASDLHVHLGLAIYVGLQLVTRERRASRIALMAVAAASPVAALLHVVFAPDTAFIEVLGNALLMVTWPAILFAVARYRRQRWVEAGDRRRMRRRTRRPAAA